jgi:hypothetical protein
VPEAWTPLETTTTDEVVFLAPPCYSRETNSS